jgi:hypothetical protein
VGLGFADTVRELVAEPEPIGDLAVLRVRLEGREVLVVALQVALVAPHAVVEVRYGVAVVVVRHVVSEAQRAVAALVALHVASKAVHAVLAVQRVVSAAQLAGIEGRLVVWVQHAVGWIPQTVDETPCVVEEIL